jgi:hypothetical protein
MDAFSHGVNGLGNGLGRHDIPFCFLDSFMYRFSNSNTIIPRVLFLHEVPWSTRYPCVPTPRSSFSIIDFAYFNPRPYPYSVSFLSSHSHSALHAPHSQPRNFVLELQRKPHGDAQEKQALFQIPKDVNRRIYKLLWRTTEELGPCIVGEDKFAAANLTGLINEGAKLGGTALVWKEDTEGVDGGRKAGGDLLSWD